MPDNPDSDILEPIEGQPSSKIEQSGVPAELADELKKTLVSFQKDLEEVKSQTRALQSNKDRGIDKVDGKLEKVLAEWEQAKKSGISQEEFIEKKDLGDRLARIEAMLSSQTAPARPSGGTENSGAFTMAKAIAKAANIQESDAEYLNILAKNINSPMKLAEEMSALVASRASKPTPTPAQSPSPVANLHGKNADDLMADYNTALSTDPFGAKTKQLKKEWEASRGG
jgi:hypothetical protein